MLLLFLSTFCSLTLGIYLLVQAFGSRPESTSVRRLRHMTRAPQAVAPRLTRGDWFRKSIARPALWLRHKNAWFVSSDLRDRLTEANYPSTVAVDLYTMIRASAVPVGVLLGLLAPRGRIPIMIVTAAVLWLGPPFAIRQQTRVRQKQVSRSIPDFVDLLSICIEVGLGLDQALVKVADELVVSHPVMHGILTRIIREQQAGKPRRQAWSDAAARLQLPEIDSFVSMLLQADRFGTPIARALEVFAQQTRLRRTQLAEERAAKTAVKILFPLVLFLFPTIFIVLLGPAVLTMIRTFSGAR